MFRIIKRADLYAFSFQLQFYIQNHGVYDLMWKTWHWMKLPLGKIIKHRNFDIIGQLKIEVNFDLYVVLIWN